MNWDKAKTVVIILLLVINAGLLYLNIQEDKKFKMTQAQEKAIASVLENNNIILDASLPQSYHPMRQLYLKSDAFEIGIPVNAFFDEQKDFERIVELEQTIFKQDNITIIFRNNQMLFDAPDGLDFIELNEKNVLNLCEAFIKKLNLPFGGLVLDTVKEKDTSYYVRYYDTIDQNLLFCNVISFIVTEKGIVNAELEKFSVEGYTGTERYIYSADEAVFSLLPELRRISKNENIHITRVDMGYDLNTIDQSVQTTTMYAVPYYRIFVKGRQEPYYVNAYTNERN